MKRSLAAFACLLCVLCNSSARAADVDLPKIIDEGTTSYVTLQFTDESGILMPPRDLYLWIADEDTGWSLLEPEFYCNSSAGGTCSGTDVFTSGTSTHTFEIGYYANRVITDTNDTETHVFNAAFRYPYDCDAAVPSPTPGYCDWGTGQASFVVKNIRGLVVSTAGPSPAPTPTP
jgi:hypothetical protein